MNLLARKFPTVLGILLLIGVGIGVYYWFTNNRPQVSAQLIPQKVRITNVTDNKFAVSWTTTGVSAGSVEYGLVGEKLDKVVADERGGGKFLTHHASVEGLQPNTQYAFRIVAEGKSRFDNNGHPYTVTSGPTIAETPPAKTLYGAIDPGSTAGADGAIAYLALPGSAPASVLVKSGGSYTFPLSIIRAADLKSYVTYDPAATVATLTIDSGTVLSTVSVSTANAAPVPLITLGENADFRNAEMPAQIAEVDHTAVPEPATGETPTIFNVEPLADINQVSSATLTIINPAAEGEVLSTLRPEFRGKGPTGVTLTIAVTGQKAISDTVKVGTDGTWSWSPVIDLKVGKQSIAASYIGSDNKEVKVVRSFNVNTTTSEPAFVATPSASTQASSTPSPTPTPVPSPRDTMPATDSGVPVTGVMTPTLLTGGAALVMMLVGAILIAF